jgi:hypothetical protein
VKKAVKFGFSFLLGVLVGALLHYTLYRMSLPIEPFIYMAF